MLGNYQDLVAKVDRKFAEIRAEAGSAMTCHVGCHGCCAPDLTVSKIEKEAIRQALLADEAGLLKARDIAKTKPHGDRRCSFLSKEGRCAIYAYRPLICRSHGAPVRFRVKQHLAKDVCPLNFQGFPLEDLPESQFINLELLNTILALTNQQAFGKRGGQRYTLDLVSILSDD